jgi:hypothetical protein
MDGDLIRVELVGGPHDGHCLDVTAGVREVALPTFVVFRDGALEHGGYRTYKRSRRKAAGGRVPFDYVPRRAKGG